MKLNLKIIVLAGLVILSWPILSKARELNFRVVPGSDQADQTSIVEVRLDPKQSDINVVEGTINFAGSVADLMVVPETGDSVLKLWPLAPVYEPVEKRIRFTGGTPDGFAVDSLLFRLRLARSSSGLVKLTFADAAGYLGDGQGTKINLAPVSANIEIKSATAANIKKTSLDSKAPEIRDVNIGREPSVYEGKKFVSWTATDDVSGVDKYLIEEGLYLTETIETTYVFKDQDRQTPVSITAFDRAGNKSIVKVSTESNWQFGVTILLIVVLILVIFVGIYVRKKNRS